MSSARTAPRPPTGTNPAASVDRIDAALPGSNLRPQRLTRGHESAARPRRAGAEARCPRVGVDLVADLPPAAQPTAENEHARAIIGGPDAVDGSVPRRPVHPWVREIVGPAQPLRRAPAASPIATSSASCVAGSRSSCCGQPEQRCRRRAGRRTRRTAFAPPPRGVDVGREHEVSGERDDRVARWPPGEGTTSTAPSAGGNTPCAASCKRTASRCMLTTRRVARRPRRRDRSCERQPCRRARRTARSRRSRRPVRAGARR